MCTYICIYICTYIHIRINVKRAIVEHSDKQYMNMVALHVFFLADVGTGGQFHLAL